MQNPRLAARYAKSLIDIAKEQNLLEAELADMQLIIDVTASNRDFTMLLRSPIVKGDKKSEIFKAIFGGKVNNLTLLFVDLLINKGREANLEEIAAAYKAQYKVLNQVHTVILTTAAPVDEDLKNTIETKVKSALNNANVDLELAVEAELIGGFVLEVGDKLFDASVRRDLNDVKNQFTKNSYVAGN